MVHARRLLQIILAAIATTAATATVRAADLPPFPPVKPVIECSELKGRKFADASIIAAQVQADGRCEIHGYGPRGIRFLAELPPTWNRRLLTGGGAGWNGVIANRPASVASGIGEYAVVRSNGGHRTPDGSALLNNPQAQQDFAHRSVHVAFESAKATVMDYYGRPAARAYFEGCSNGGREGLMQAIHYPGDYDGIIVRDPAFNFTYALLAVDRNMRLAVARMTLMPKAGHVGEKSIDHCDALDGLDGDNIVHNQASCRFDVFELLCGRSIHASCLTIEEAKSAQAIYNPLRLGGGTPVHEGWGPGGEEAWFWYPPQHNWHLFTITAGLIKFWLAKDPNFDPINFAANNYQRQIGETAGLLDAPPKLGAFFARGGKLIMANGTHDWIVSYKEAIKYFDDVEREAGKELRDQNMEFFLIPGVQHCGIGGNGPNELNWLALLVDWVEAGKRPSEQGAALSGGDLSRRLSRPLCRYPRYAHYAGGPHDTAASFKCQ